MIPAIVRSRVCCGFCAAPGEDATPFARSVRPPALPTDTNTLRLISAVRRGRIGSVLEISVGRENERSAR
jgi:hypothetical protein